MKIEEALQILNSNFIYKVDKYSWLDTWRIMQGNIPWYGDCEDYSLTLIWLLSNQNIFLFFWNILIHRYKLYFVILPNNEGHIVTKIDNLYYDNIFKRGIEKTELLKQNYKFKFLFISPLIFIKLIISYTIGRLFR